MVDIPRGCYTIVVITNICCLIIFNFVVTIDSQNLELYMSISSAVLSTTRALGEISTAPSNCNSKPYEKRQRI